MSNTPKRTFVAEALFKNILMVAMDLKRVKEDATETNCALAFCELAVSIPNEWFTHEERMVVLTTIGALTNDDPRKFITAISDGSLSYYNKMRPKGSQDVDSAARTMYEMHMVQFGTSSI